MWTTEDQTMAAGHSVDVDPTQWQELFHELLGRVAGRFGRVELRRRARAFVRGLLADLPRMNCWTIAEHAGDPNPDGMKHLLGRAVWDHDKVRDDIRDYVIDHLGDPGEVLVVRVLFLRPLPEPCWRAFPAHGSPVIISGWWLWPVLRGCPGGSGRRPRGSCVCASPSDAPTAAVLARSYDGL